MSIRRLLWFVMVGFSIVSVVSAQSDICEMMLDTVLETVGDACDDLGSNQICYGNNMLDASDFSGAAIEDFATSGDLVDISDVATIESGGFDLDSEIWGLGLLSLQADLPNTVAGQHVTFVIFGDTQLRNQVVPEDDMVASLSATSTNGSNVRAENSTNSAVIGSLVSGESVTLIGRDAAANWVEIEFGEDTAWVFADILTIDGDINLLAVTDGSDMSAYAAPMQAFQLTTGIGQVGCDDVPPSGVLIQAPTDTSVHFMVNGIEVELGSTVFIRIVEGRIQIVTIEGIVTVTSGDVSQVIEPGMTVYISVDGEPGLPIEFDYDDFQSLPLILLPEPIGIPLLVRSDNTWRGSGIFINAGDSFTLHTGGVINFWDNCEAEKVANGQPDIDCDSLIFDPAGGDPVTLSGEVLGSDMSLFPVPSAPPHSLVGRIGSSTFFVGNGGDFTAAESGILEFRANDVDLNNLGAFFVSVVFP